MNEEIEAQRGQVTPWREHSSGVNPFTLSYNKACTLRLTLTPACNYSCTKSLWFHWVSWKTLPEQASGMVCEWSRGIHVPALTSCPSSPSRWSSTAKMARRGSVWSSRRVMFCSEVIESSVACPAEVSEKDPSPLSDR